jgi:tetratricopeptide (TPR) repeat protein
MHGIPIRPSRPERPARVAWALVLATLVTTARPARAAEPEVEDAAAATMKPEARALYEHGLTQYQAKDFAGAIDAFERGYAVDPRREFLFADAQARRLAGDCRGAVPLYQRFLETDPPAVQASATHLGLSRCAQQMAAEKPAPPPVAMPVPAPPPPPPPWTRDRAGAALLATGVVALGVGAGFLAASFAALPSANAGSYADYAAARDRADGRHAVGVVALVGGGAFVAAGIARYAWVRHERRATLTIVPGGLAFEGSF